MREFRVEYKCKQCQNLNDSEIVIDKIYATKELPKEHFFRFECKNCGKVHYVNEKDTTQVLTDVTMQEVGVVAF